MGITTHVLDTAEGLPAAGLGVTLERLDEGQWHTLATRATDDDGRVRDLLPAGATAEPGTYRLTFATGPYLTARTGRAFYPEVQVIGQFGKVFYLWRE